MTRFDPDPRCAVCDGRVASGASHCGGAACLRYEVRKEHIRKDQYNASDPAHFRLQSRGGAWRYYRKLEPSGPRPWTEIMGIDPAAELARKLAGE